MRCDDSAQVVEFLVVLVFIEVDLVVVEVLVASGNAVRGLVEFR